MGENGINTIASRMLKKKKKKLTFSPSLVQEIMNIWYQTGEATVSILNQDNDPQERLT